jgi:triosephosphate isomerase
MARTTLIAGNWKMHKTVAETRRFIHELRNKLLGIDARAGVVVCPPFVALEAAVEAAGDTGIEIGAQNASSESEGAFTGEISPAMLESLGVRYVLLGHSERRTLFGETDELVNRKLARALAYDLMPIVCLGETLEEREGGRTEAVVTAQVRAALDGVAPDHAGRLAIAYEPIWAIGTGRTASPEVVDEAHGLIRRTLAAIFGGASADRVRLLYGGSVKPANAEGLLAQADIDGVLVGGASLDAATFAEIVRCAP